MKDRYAVRREGGFVGANSGRCWRTHRPTYNTVPMEQARLFFRKADATKAAQAVGGTVVRAALTMIDE